MIIELTNYEIYQKILSFKCLKDNTIYYPARVIFYIQKNIKTLTELNDLIIEAKNSIIQHYGQQTEEGKIFLSEEILPMANKELNELMEVKQNIEITPIPLSCIEGLNFTPEQMAALAFMIDETK